MIAKPQLPIYARGGSTKLKKSSERDVAYAEGGADHMMSKQAANPQKPGRTAHDVKGRAPGARAAEGGAKTRGTSAAMPAAPGHDDSRK